MIQALVLDSRAVGLEQPGELAGVGREHGRRGSYGQVLEPSGMRVQSVCVQDHDLRFGGELACERARAGAASEPRS